ncbi:MAG: hypothetical protein IR153_04795 [Flavobacterium sp.]|nr:hypothetical protein [Flavobacterium sp.]
MKVFILIFISLIFFGTNAQPASNLSLGHLEEIANRKKIVYKRDSEFAPSSPFNDKLFIDFNNSISDVELLSLTEHRDAYVRCFAFQALVQRKHPDTFSILLIHLTEYDLVKIHLNDTSSSSYVGDYFLILVNPENVWSDIKKLSGAERRAINHLLLANNENKLVAKSDLLRGKK